MPSLPLQWVGCAWGSSWPSSPSQWPPVCEASCPPVLRTESALSPTKRLCEPMWAHVWGHMRSCDIMWDHVSPCVGPCVVIWGTHQPYLLWVLLESCSDLELCSTKLAALSQRLITTSIKLGLECLPYLFNELVVLEALPGLHHPHNGRLCVKLPVLLYWELSLLYLLQRDCVSPCGPMCEVIWDHVISCEIMWAHVWAHVWLYGVHINHTCCESFWKAAVTLNFVLLLV